ncbi:MAG: succinate dehydrogenase, hydrophobic membrane anchor protein [Alphaproteobacteria bacterium]|nr:succinate dehydrogenase, hydrophobic membrane anchor protein [Alphaproteobacteria bacterium]
MAASRPSAPLRSPLGRAIGLGSAKEGVEHWWHLRITSIALVPLCLWFVGVLIGLAGADLDTFSAWLAHPVPAIVMALLLIATFYHTELGLQVVIEDYVHAEGLKLGLLIVMRLACIALAVAGLFAVLRIGLGT